MIWAKFWPWKNCTKLTLIRLKFCSKRVFLHVSKIFKKLYLLFYVKKKTIKECPVPLDISIKPNKNTIKQFCIVNLTKTWLGDFLGNFSLSLGDFFTKTFGHPGTVDLLALASLDQLLFILKILFTLFSEQATLMRRSTVQHLPL